MNAEHGAAISETPELDAVTVELHQHLDALAEDLRARGFTVEAAKSGHRDGLRVTSKAQPMLSETVYLAPNEEATWWFWWSWNDQLAPVKHVEVAAFKIAFVLTPA